MPPISSALRARFLALERWTTRAALAGACAMLVAAACLGLYQILARFVFQQPAEWSEVLIRFTLIWMVFLAIPCAFREGAMVSVDVAYRKGGRKTKRVLDALIALAALVLVGVLIGYGIDYAWRARFQTISGLESFSMMGPYLAVPVGALFSVLAIVGALLEPRHRELETAQ